MRILHFTNNLFDGGGKAVYALHTGLQKAGVHSTILVQKKIDEDEFVFQVCGKYPLLKFSTISILKKQLIGYYLRKVLAKLRVTSFLQLDLFNYGLSFTNIDRLKKYLNDIDIICFYSIQEFLSPKLIREIVLEANVPVVWTTMDNEPLSGGCHFNGECDRYHNSCGECPKLLINSKNDLSKKLLNEKTRYLNDLPITFIAASNWVKKQISCSSVFKGNDIVKIMLGVDHNIFKQGDKKTARKELGIPHDKKIILFGCFNLNDKRKGGGYLVESFRYLHNIININYQDLKNNVMLVTFGNSKAIKLPTDISFKSLHLGQIDDDQVLAKALQTADVFVSPSIDDFGPRIVIEAFSCEIPVVSYNLGVAPDLITDNKDGFIIDKYETKEFAKAILNCLLNKKTSITNEDNKLRVSCQLDYQVKQYKKLFGDLVFNYDRKIIND